jgi:glycosyltransferase involved in cell wall biosynthesis
MNKNIFLSVASPVYNEEKNIEQVVRDWNTILNSADFVSEIVVTNDGSIDKTLDILTQLKKEITRLKIVNHEKNCGYGQALSSSIKNSSGEWVVMLDSDGQFDLGEYALLLEKARKEKLDGVTGFRKKKQEIVIKLSTIGARLGELGITHFKREVGISKLSPIRTGINFMKFLLYLKIKINLYNKKLLFKL